MPTVSEADNLRGQLRLQSRLARKRSYVAFSSSSSSTSTVSTTTSPGTSDSEGEDEIDVVTCDETDNASEILKKRKMEQVAEDAAARCRHFAYTDILLKPHLLAALKGHDDEEEGKIKAKTFSSSLTKTFYDDADSVSANPLLEFCLEGGYKVARPVRNEHLAPILAACHVKATATSNINNNYVVGHFNLERLEELMRLCRTQGCDINVRSVKGYSAMHFLIRGEGILDRHNNHNLLIVGADVP